MYQKANENFNLNFKLAAGAGGMRKRITLGAAKLLLRLRRRLKVDSIFHLDFIGRHLAGAIQQTNVKSIRGQIITFPYFGCRDAQTEQSDTKKAKSTSGEADIDF